MNDNIKHTIRVLEEEINVRDSSSQELVFNDALRQGIEISHESKNSLCH